MEKIMTIFDRDWQGNRGVVNKRIVTIPPIAIATEKVDGTNVRLTCRNHILVRVEKRRNPSKTQKLQGIVDPWYVDCDSNSPEDKHILEASANCPLDDVPDGEWSGEAIGPNIQGNPLKLEIKTVLLFSLDKAPVISDVPTDFESLKIWLPKQRSQVGDGIIEGIVWRYPSEIYRGHHLFLPVGKLKNKDFK